MPGTCPLCASEASREVLDLGPLPVFCHLLYERPEDARAVPRGRMRLVQCGSCGLLFNAEFEPQLMRYAPAYENAQHHSPRFSAFLDEQAGMLASRHLPGGGAVVELGCGDGVFLARLCEASGARGLGFDPAAPDRSPSDSVRLVRGLPGADETWVADLVCLRHVLEHVVDPCGFLRRIRAHSQGAPALYCEVPNGEWMLSGAGFFDLLYEHVLYFTSATLRAALAAGGWSPASVGGCFAGQFLAAEARPGAPDPTGGGALLPQVREEEERRASRFAADCRRVVEQTRDLLRAGVAEGRSQALWGAGTKGVRLLQHLAEDAGHLRVVDVNPRKHGRHLAATAHLIEAPASLVERPVDEILMANAVYREEIQAWLAGHGLAPTLRTLPSGGGPPP